MTSFVVLWHPELMLSTVLLAAAYLDVVGPLRSRFREGAPVAAAQRAAFLAGLLAVYIAQGSPLELYANLYLFSAHMLQMVLLVFVAPPLLLRGTPTWLLRPLFSAVAPLRSLVRWVTHPGRALLLFLFVFSVYLAPVLTDSALASGPLFLLEHLLSVGVALAVWWPIMSPLPELPPLPEPGQLLYSFLVELGMTVAFALVTFAGRPIYAVYAHAPRVIPLSPLEDQQLGGILMRVGSMTTFGVVFASRFFRWARREGAPDRVDPLPTAAADAAEGPGR